VSTAGENGVAALRGTGQGLVWKRAVAVITVLGFSVPVIAYFWLIQHYGVNAIWYDQWNDINVIAHPTLSNLWLQHNEDRIFFPNLIVVVLAHTTHFDVHIENYLGAVMLVGAAALFILTHRRRSPTTLWLLYCPVVIVMFSFVQAGNTLFGFQIAWFLIMLALASVLFLLDRPELTWQVFAGAVALAAMGSFSSLQGLLIWVSGFVLLYCRSRVKGFLIGWIVAAAASVVLYLFHFSSTVGGTNNSYVFSHPLLATEFFFSAIGDVVHQQLPYAGLNVSILVLGISIVVSSVLVVIVYGFRRNDSASAVGVALIVFGLLFAVSITSGRTAYGIWYSDSSRYTSFDLLIVVGTYLAVLEGRPRQADMTVRGDVATRSDPTGRFWDRLVLVIRVLAAASIVLLVVVGTGNGITEANAWHKRLTEASQVTVNIKKAPDDLVSAVLYPLPLNDVGFVRRMAGIADTDKLSLFSTSAAAHFARVGLPAELKFTSKVSKPADGATLRGGVFMDATASVKFGTVTVNATRVDFEIRGAGRPPISVGPAAFSIYGWLGGWDSATVPNGHYKIQSVAYDSAGRASYSPFISVVVDNP
jgi:hypothetical protein